MEDNELSKPLKAELGHMQDKMAVVGDEPDVNLLCEEMKRATTTYGVGTRTSRAENIRYCRWDGQTEDGRKWATSQGEDKALPWDGASDTRYPLADDIINGLVDLQTTAFTRATLKVSPQGLEDAEKSGSANTLMDWLLNARLYTELTREVELISQYIWTYGWAAAHISWQQQTGQVEREISIEEIAQLAQQAPQGNAFATLPQAIADESQADYAAEIFQSVFPQLKKRDALRVVKELREKGKSEFPTTVITRSQPSIAALAPWDEIAIPPETTDLQSARVIFRRCYMTEHELRQHVQNDEWDADWADSAIQMMGKFSNSADWTMSTGLSNNQLVDRENLIEIVYGYQKAVDKDGNPGVWCTVFSPQVGDKWGSYELLDYAHGGYPFVAWRSETIHRKIVESRGVPEIVSTWQAEAKAQRDSILDYTSLSTIPPLMVPKNRGGTLKLGPAVQLPCLRPSEYQWMVPPAREPNTAFMLLDHIELQADRYFGRPTEKVPPAVTQMRQQRIINTWLHGWTDVFRQALSLAVQYLDPEVVARVTGIQADLGEASQQLDMHLRFDARELNSDLLEEKMKLITTLVAQSDKNGVLDWGKLTPALLRMIDPAIANQVIMDNKTASQKMFDDTNSEVALMAAGNPPKLRENDPTAQMRLQFLQQILQSNPKYQQSLKGNDDVFKANLQKYAENLQFSVQQQQNAMTGRLGVDPNAAPTA